MLTILFIDPSKFDMWYYGDFWDDTLLDINNTLSYRLSMKLFPFSLIIK
jgi:hypothetical protein